MKIIKNHGNPLFARDYSIHGFANLRIETDSDENLSMIDKELGWAKANSVNPDLVFHVGQFAVKELGPLISMGKDFYCDKDNRSVISIGKYTKGDLSDIKYFMSRTQDERCPIVLVNFKKKRYGRFHQLARIAIHSSTYFELEISLWNIVNMLCFPFIHCVLQSHGLTLLRASSVAINENGILFHGQKHSGKSTIMHEFLRKGYQYGSDDYSILSEDGLLYSFPTRTRVSKEESDQYPEVMQTMIKEINSISRWALKLNRLLGGMALRVQRVSADNIISDSSNGMCNKLGVVFNLSPYTGNEVVIRQISVSSFIQRCLYTIEKEFTFYEYADPRSAGMRLGSEQFFGGRTHLLLNAQKILQKALGEVSPYEVLLPQGSRVENVVDLMMESIPTDTIPKRT